MKAIDHEQHFPGGSVSYAMQGGFQIFSSLRMRFKTASIYIKAIAK